MFYEFWACVEISSFMKVHKQKCIFDLALISFLDCVMMRYCQASDLASALTGQGKTLWIISKASKSQPLEDIPWFTSSLPQKEVRITISLDLLQPKFSQ